MPKPATGTWRPANGSEGDAWQQAWCNSCEQDADEDCPILLNLLIGEHDPHVRCGPMWSPATAGYCMAWTPRKEGE